MRRATSTVVLGLALTGAIGGSTSAQAPRGQPATPSAVTAPEGTAGPGLTYERKGRRDPFEPIETLHTNMTSPTVASAKLKGIVRSRTPLVLVETSDGLGYILKVGDMLAEARLIEIGTDSIVFSVPARSGSTNRFVLRLPDD